MLTNNDLKQIKTLLTPLERDIKVVKKQLNNVDMKVEIVNKRVGLLDEKIGQTQQETIETLSELIHEGYNLHEKRIKKVEENLQPPQTQ